MTRNLGPLERFAKFATHWTGGSTALALAFLVIIVWACTGPMFGYSDTWQLVINTGTTIVTFLMVFLIQRSQNKDSLAVQLKLNEIVAALNGASNRLINVEDLAELDIELLHKHYAKLSELAACEEDIHCSHSIDEAQRRHDEKLEEEGDLKENAKSAEPENAS
ncbi:MAG: low affinity iron permease family protein [Pirellulales bacterium]